MIVGLFNFSNATQCINFFASGSAVFFCCFCSIYCMFAGDCWAIADLVSYIAAGEIKPLLAATYPLEKLHDAQEAFIKKEHIGNIVVEVAGE